MACPVFIDPAGNIPLGGSLRNQCINSGKVLPGDNGIMMGCRQILSASASPVLMTSVLVICEGLLVECIPDISLVSEEVVNGALRPAFAPSGLNPILVKFCCYGMSSFARQCFTEYAFHNLRLFWLNLKSAVFPSVAVGRCAYLEGTVTELSPEASFGVF